MSEIFTLSGMAQAMATLPLPPAPANNDSLSLLVSALGIVVSFVLGIASYLIASPTPEVSFWNFESKHDNSLLLNEIKKLINLKKAIIKWLPAIYIATFFGLLIALWAIKNHTWIVMIYVIVLVVLFCLLSYKVQEIIQSNIVISERLHSKSMAESQEQAKRIADSKDGMKKS